MNRTTSLPKDYGPVSISGIGFVGLTLSIALAEAGFQVMAFDLDKKLINNLKLGQTSVVEPGIEELITRHIELGNLTFLHVDDDLHLLKNCKTHVITVGTPIKDGHMDDQPIKRSVEFIASLIKPEDLVIVRSTVGVGVCRKILYPRLRGVHHSISLAMCPERTVEGNALNEIRELPQIVGGIDQQSTDKASGFFSLICNSVINVSTIESAELLKLVNNTYRDLNFAFANEIAKLGQKMNLDVREIIAAANLNYGRSNIPAPGPSGGPCLEKDPWILVASAKELGVDLELPSASRRINETNTLEFVEESIKGFVREKVAKVALLGLSFKGTPLVKDLRGSEALRIVERLKVHKNLTFFGYEEAGYFDSNLGPVQQTELQETIAGADVVIICNNNPSLSQSSKLIASYAKSDALVLDLWGIINKSQILSSQKILKWG